MIQGQDGNFIVITCQLGRSPVHIASMQISSVCYLLWPIQINPQKSGLRGQISKCRIYYTYAQ